MTHRLAHDLDSILSRTEALWSDLRGERVLITGATGFFGCWLLESFAWANRRLNLKAQTVALSRNPGILAEKAPHLAADPSIVLHATDIRRGGFPSGKFSYVIHAATAASAKLNTEEPLAMFDTIVEGTENALEFADKHAGVRFLFLSSGAVYGEQPPDISHVSESFEGGPDPLRRSNAYAEGKRAAEMLCTLYASQKLEIPIARGFAFVGPYMPLDTHFAIGNFISDILQGQPVRVKGDGSPVRSYLYASDLAVWLWTMLFKGKSGRAYNVGSEEALTVATLANEVAAAAPAKTAVQIAPTPQRNMGAHRYVPSTARAGEELGLRAEVPLREAIQRTYVWYAASQTRIDAHRQEILAARGAHA